MFKVRSFGKQIFISDGMSNYLHCDGRTISVCEYFESKEAAQKILDKYYPEPEHEWKHGDVFEAYDKSVLICIKIKGILRVFGLGHPNFNEAEEYDTGVNLDKDAKFLFNITEKL